MDTVFSGVGQITWRWLELLGLNAEKEFAAQGFDQRVLRDPNKRLSIPKRNKIWRSALEQVGDPCAGLMAALCWQPSNLGALRYPWLTSDSLRMALLRFQRYSKVVSTLDRFIVEDMGEGVALIVEEPSVEIGLDDFSADLNLAIVMDMCRVNYGAALRPVLVRLKRQEPDCNGAHSRFFGCQIEFSAPENCFVLSHEDADSILPSSNKQLTGVHDKILVGQLAALDKEDVTSLCKAEILDKLTTGHISADEVAAALRISLRTLTRRLEAEGTSFNKILDETRKALAQGYLLDRRNSFSEVAFLLGFSQQSSLTRASNRWFGSSPSQYRNQLELGDME